VRRILEGWRKLLAAEATKDKGLAGEVLGGLALCASRERKGNRKRPDEPVGGRRAVMARRIGRTQGRGPGDTIQVVARPTLAARAAAARASRRADRAGLNASHVGTVAGRPVEQVPREIDVGAER